VTITVRAAAPPDLPAILQMVRDLAEFERMADEVTFDPDEFGRHLFGPDPAATVDIAEIDGDVAGMALWFRTFSTFLGKPGIWLEDLYVHPQHRGHGVGGALLRHLRSLTEGRVEWTVLDWNTAASAAYHAIGATPDTGGWIAYRWAAE
jgi:GNAT superfamily N-acetyltransferase